MALAVAACGIFASAAGQSATAQNTIPIGAAKVDITPDYPIRLTGYASRKTECEGVEHRIWARAVAIGGNEGEGPAILMTVENCGVPDVIVSEVAKRLERQAGVRRARFAVCSSHTHGGPWLIGFARALLSEALPPEHRVHMEQYGREVTDKMEKLALSALAARKPGKLDWAQGSAQFAMNRRPVTAEKKCPGLGVNPAGPVDNAMPMLRATDADGKLIAAIVNYACHCTTLGGEVNKIHGDWAGIAQETIEAQYPGATALVCIGCGADANPGPRGKPEMMMQYGQAIAEEVKRLLGGKLTPVAPKLNAARQEIRLPLAEVPTREQLEARVATAKNPKATALDKRRAEQAADCLAQLDRGEKLPDGLNYSVTTWRFGNDLAMVFLPGEVVVDFALRLKREVQSPPLWISAYSNDVPCYIVSRRVLEEGGYEPDTSMLYYGWPSRLSPAVEDLIVNTAESLLAKTAK